MARVLGDASAAMRLARLCRAIAQVQSLAEQLDSEVSLGHGVNESNGRCHGTKIFYQTYTGWLFFLFGMNTDM